MLPTMFSAASERPRHTLAASALRGAGLIDKERDKDKERDRDARMSDASAGGAKRTAKVRSHAHKTHVFKDASSNSRTSLVSFSSCSRYHCQSVLSFVCRTVLTAQTLT